MSDEILSREEVDVLLKGVEPDTAAAVEVPDAAAVKPYNLAAQERIVRGRMPAFDLISERFVRLFRAGLFALMRRSVTVEAAPLRVIKYADFTRELTAPVNLNLVQMKPLRGTALFIFESQLVSVVVDTMFGGGGRSSAAQQEREFTPTEHRIIQRMLEAAFEASEKSWEPVHAIKFEYVRSETNPRFVTIATPHELVVATTFRIKVGDTGGAFHLCIPQQMLEPIRDVLHDGFTSHQRESAQRSARRLAEQVQLAEIELVASLGRAPTTLRQVLNMKVGDVIPIAVDETIVAHVDGVPVMECSYGTSNARYALKVSRWTNPAAGGTKPGEHHA